MSVEKASNMTVFFYVGGILGEIVSGVVADVTGCSGVTALGLCIFSGPVLYALFHAGERCSKIQHLHGFAFVRTKHDIIVAAGNREYFYGLRNGHLTLCTLC